MLGVVMDLHVRDRVGPSLHPAPVRLLGLAV